MTKRPLWLIAAPVIFLLLWSAGFAVAKLGLQHAEPLTMLALRYGVLVLLLLPLALIFRPPLPKTRRGWLDIAVVGFLIQVVYFVLCYVAFKSGVSAGTVSIIVCLQPILVALSAPLVGEKISRLGWLGLALGISGALIVILARSTLEIAGPFGLTLTVLALLGITGGTLYEKRFGVSHHPITSNLIQYTVGAAVTLPAAWASETMQIQWDIEFVLVMLYLVVGNSLLAMSLLLAMIRVGEVSRVSALFYLVPAISAVFAWPILGEPVPALAWAGMALAGLGVALASRKVKAPVPADPA